MEKQFFVYIMSNNNDTVLYTGVTNNLVRRVTEHREGITPGFTSKYRVTKLVYYEIASTAEIAIQREKQIKASRRSKKEELIDAFNAQRRDLSEELF